MNQSIKLSEKQRDVLAYLSDKYVIVAYFSKQSGYESAWLRKYRDGVELDQQTLPLYTFKALLKKEVIQEVGRVGYDMVQVTFKGADF